MGVVEMTEGNYPCEIELSPSKSQSPLMLQGSIGSRTGQAGGLDALRQVLDRLCGEERLSSCGWNFKVKMQQLESGLSRNGRRQRQKGKSRGRDDFWHWNGQRRTEVETLKEEHQLVACLM
ncbi:hypothetical protein GE061_016389 [Apolygus lucorum]|uniref:Uncharacterized protein n=1 Tax=Apolygus lucorum TaxID=248454 RepID=A0A8S9XFV9_APOLU|nr:hypothetical protein GE061_016389 [Apolygus lucorum]